MLRKTALLYRLAEGAGYPGSDTFSCLAHDSQMYYSDAAHLTPLWVLSKGVYECAGIIFLLNLGRLYLNRRSRALGYLNRESFKIYVFHYLPVTFFTWLFISFEMHIFVKFLLVVVLSYLTVFFICGLWQRVKSRIMHGEKKHGDGRLCKN